MATWAAAIKPEDPFDVRVAEVPALANVDTGGPEWGDGGQPAPAEGEPETRRQGLSPEGWAGRTAQRGGSQRESSPPVVHH